MMKKVMMLLVIVITLLVLSACGGTTDTAETGDDGRAVGQLQTTIVVRLSSDYADALSAQEQLALGTLKLEETELAVDEALAAKLLPLWQALQSLSNSDTVADAELNAVANQIQDSMLVEQIQAIAEMKLTDENLTAFLESGDLGFNPGNFGAAGDGSAGGEGFPDGGVSGSRPGGGPGNGGFSDLSEDDMATRQAKLAESGFESIQDRMLIGAVVRQLQTKTGEAPEPNGNIDTAFTNVNAAK